MRLVISAGGTGGHIYPALAIIKEFQKQEKNLEVLYIGTHNRMEKDIVPKNNIPYKAIEIYGFSKNVFKDFKNAFLLVKAYNKCLKILQDFKPDVVIGVGGYVTLPVVMAAKKLKIKTFIHEQNSIPGKTNKFLSKGVDGVFTSFLDSKKYFASHVNVIHTGHPGSDNVLNLKPMKKESLGFHKDKKLVLIVGGSLGSSSLNQKLESFLELSKNHDYEVLFITGQNSYDNFKKKKYGDNIKVLPYLDNLASLLKSCDLVISRAGAGIIFEILASRVPAILIPSPNVANNHQYYNAADLSNQGLALMILENELDSKLLYQKVKELLSDNKAYQEIKNKLNAYELTSSSDKIYKIVKEAISNAK